MNDFSDKAGGYVWLLKAVGFSLVSALAAFADHIIFGSASGAFPAALAGGIGLAGLVILGKGMWPAVVLGQFGGAILYLPDTAGMAWLAAAIGNTLSIILGAQLITGMRLPAKPDNLEAMLRYIAFGAGTVALGSTIVATVSGLVLSPGPRLATLSVAFSFLFSSFAWTLIIGSLLQSCWSERRQPLPGALVPPLIAIALAEGAFLYFAPASSDYIWCGLPLLVWAGIVGKVRGAAVGLTLIAIPSFIISFGTGTLPTGIFWPEFDLFLCMAAPTALLIAALNMEGSLHRRSQRALALGNPHEGRFEYYPRSHRLKVDQDVKELLGISSDGSIIREEAVLARVHEEDHEAVAAFLRDLSSGPSPEPIHVEFRVSTRSGATTWLVADGVSVLPHLGALRTPVASYGVIRDISQQKESEQRLIDSDRFLHSIIENLLTFVAVLKLDGTVIETNRPNLCAVPGTSDDVIGQKVWDCYWWGQAQGVQETLRTAVEDARNGIVSEHDLQMRNGEGTLAWMEVQMAPLRDENGSITHLIISGSDLTARLEAEAQAHRMAAIIEATPDFVGIADAEGRFIYVSPGGVNLMEASPDTDFVGQDMALVHPEECRDLLMNEALPAARLTGVWEGQTELLTVDGIRRPISQVILGHFDQQGDLQRISTVIRDMTEQKRAEQQQRILLRELAHRVKNMLAVIQGFTRQTLRVHPDPQDFSRIFQGRVASLAASHSLLTESGWQGAQLRHVLQLQLSPAVPDGAARLSLNGPDVTLPSEVATTLGLIIHELGSNAAQHGGWAGRDGAVVVEWSVKDAILHIAWQETGIAVPASETVRPGFGSSLLDMSVRSVNRRYEKGKFLLDFEVTLFSEPSPQKSEMAE